MCLILCWSISKERSFTQINPDITPKTFLIVPLTLNARPLAEGKDKVYLSDIYFDKAEDNRFEMLVTAPAFDFNSVSIGVIAFEVDMTTVYKLVQDAIGLGNTGETLIGKKIGNQVVFLNPLRHDPNAALVRTANYRR